MLKQKFCLWWIWYLLFDNAHFQRWLAWHRRRGWELAHVGGLFFHFTRGDGTDYRYYVQVMKDFPWTESTISLARLLQEPFLSCPEQYVEQYLPADTPRLEVAASDDGAILSMVAGGLGVSVLSAFSLAGYENRVRVIPLDRPLSRRLGVAVKSMPAANSPARLFLAFLKRQYQTAAQEK